MDISGCPALVGPSGSVRAARADVLGARSDVLGEPVLIVRVARVDVLGRPVQMCYVGTCGCVRVAHADVLGRPVQKR